MTDDAPGSKATHPPTAGEGPVAAKRRVSLPVLGSQATLGSTLLDRLELGNSETGERSPIAWVGLGTMAIFVVLVPLAMLTMAGLRVVSSVSSTAWSGLVVMVSTVTPAIASWAGGCLVGRFGGRAGPREAMLAGLAAGIVMWGLSHMWLGSVILVVTTPGAWLGGRFGCRRRRQSPA